MGHLDKKALSRAERAKALGLQGMRGMGALEFKRLSDVVEQAQRVGVQGSVAEKLSDDRVIEIVARRFHVPSPSLAECRRHYLAHPEEFRRPDRYAGRQIILPCDPGDSAAFAETHGRAERLIAILQFAPTMFSDLLASYGRCAGGVVSGSIGPAAPLQLPNRIRIALVMGRPGQVWPVPVESDLGIHVVMLDRIIGGEIEPFRGVSATIGELLHDRMRRAAACRHLQRLARRHAAANGQEGAGGEVTRDLAAGPIESRLLRD